ncbi:class I SAM-dependent methyltransferase [Winogradskyella aurantiaca]|uniref:class I SAM-dependent methyltransferase n=1 Tax=Winogradskyella aurantiaca TaxID=2219558 RepID=UPI000E1E0BA4|nr:class I SAM-dependent methyltransferase [Winogradskyella aurantiaca]
MKGSSSEHQNKLHYDQLYSKTGIEGHLKFLKNRDEYFKEYVSTHISWHGFYYKNFQDTLNGKTVLELGAGDALNAAVMASFGAKVLANDISAKTGELINTLNADYPFKHPIEFIGDDFLLADIPEDSVDLVVGKALIHHLDHQLEEQFIKKIVTILKNHGEVRFFEPAVNSKLLDELRWATPVPGRPSKWFQPKKFKAWETRDPHPHRDNSSKHYETIGRKYFREVLVEPFGIFDRFYRVLPITGRTKVKFRQSVLKYERIIPKWLRRKGARSQLILYKNR